MLGVVKDNLERDADEELDPGLAKFSATRWTVRAICFKRIFINYKALQETWKDCLKQGGLSTDIKACVIGCQAQMNSFDYFFGVIIGEHLFSHSDKLSPTLEKK